VRELRNDLLSISRLSERIRQLEKTLAEKQRALAETREMLQGVKISDLKLDMKRNFERASKLSRILSRLAKKLSVKKEERSEGAKVDNFEPKSARGEGMPASLASRGLSLPIKEIKSGNDNDGIPQSARQPPHSARDRKLVFQPRSARKAHLGSEQAEIMKAKDKGLDILVKAAEFGLADDGYVYVKLLQDGVEIGKSPPAACIDGNVEWALFRGINLKKGSGMTLEFHEVDNTGENMDNIISTAILTSVHLDDLNSKEKNLNRCLKWRGQLRAS